MICNLISAKRCGKSKAKKKAPESFRLAELVLAPHTLHPCSSLGWSDMPNGMLASSASGSDLTNFACRRHCNVPLTFMVFLEVEWEQVHSIV